MPVLIISRNEETKDLRKSEIVIMSSYTLEVFFQNMEIETLNFFPNRPSVFYSLCFKI
jgi:hypothetical protein